MAIEPITVSLQQTIERLGWWKEHYQDWGDYKKDALDYTLDIGKFIGPMVVSNNSVTPIGSAPEKLDALETAAKEALPFMASAVAAEETKAKSIGTAPSSAGAIPPFIWIAAINLVIEGIREWLNRRRAAA